MLLLEKKVLFLLPADPYQSCRIQLPKFWTYFIVEKPLSKLVDIFYDGALKNTTFFALP
jgi:hypothetical protein